MQEIRKEDVDLFIEMIKTKVVKDNVEFLIEIVIKEIMMIIKIIRTMITSEIEAIIVVTTIDIVDMITRIGKTINVTKPREVIEREMKIRMMITIMKIGVIVDSGDDLPNVIIRTINVMMIQMRIMRSRDKRDQDISETNIHELIVMIATMVISKKMKVGKEDADVDGMIILTDIKQDVRVIRKEGLIIMIKNRKANGRQEMIVKDKNLVHIVETIEVVVDSIDVEMDVDKNAKYMLRSP